MIMASISPKDYTLQCSTEYYKLGRMVTENISMHHRNVVSFAALWDGKAKFMSGKMHSLV